MADDQQPHGPLTVFEVLKRVFPWDGGNVLPYHTWPHKNKYPKQHAGDYSTPKEDRQAYALPPALPFDLFAIAGYLLELSGAYHHVIPNMASIEAGPGTKRLIRVSTKMIDECRQLASLWRQEPVGTLAGWKTKRDELEELLKGWDELFGKYGSSPVFVTVEHTDEPPGWWAIALKLFIVADEAAIECGFALGETQRRSDALAPAPQPWFELLALEAISEEFDKQVTQDESLHKEGNPRRSPQSIMITSWLKSLSRADRDVVAVLPKARTTAAGVTIRSLSHHLALLPPRGIARGEWIPYLQGTPPSDELELNLLLVPYPFTITEKDFHAAPGIAGETKRWGYFDVEQRWLDAYGKDARHQLHRHLTEFVTELALTAERDAGAKSINAIVFPELALDLNIFQNLADDLGRRLPKLEFVVAGVSGKHNGRVGNFVAMRLFQGRDGSDRGIAVETIREKHHRWKLDNSQLRDYGLDDVLNPQLDWWENIHLMSRRVDFTVFRWGSVLAAMICEDLARVDPCQELLRAIGPNIVISLLMDAPQLQTRWPARYATVLAEDPGSAVLTLTSRGLMTHQHSRKRMVSVDDKDRVIALWRDEASRPREISCPYGSHAVWLKLWGGPTSDTTLDGRTDTTSISWRYGLDRPISIPDAATRYKPLLGDEDIQAAKDREQKSAGVPGLTWR